jgi:hypothetical protein
MLGEDHRKSPARLARIEALTCQDVVTPAPPRPTQLERAWARLAFPARRLGRPTRTNSLSRAVSATDLALSE